MGSSGRGGAGALLLAYFVFLGLGSLAQDFMAVIIWVCIFEEVLWDGRWLLEQRASKSQTMV